MSLNLPANPTLHLRLVHPNCDAIASLYGYFKNQMTSPNDDTAAGIEVTDEFERFAQHNDVFTRAFWDEKVRTKQTDGFFASYRMEARHAVVTGLLSAILHCVMHLG